MELALQPASSTAGVTARSSRSRSCMALPHTSTYAIHPARADAVTPATAPQYPITCVPSGLLVEDAANHESLAMNASADPASGSRIHIRKSASVCCLRPTPGRYRIRLNTAVANSRPLIEAITAASTVGDGRIELS